MNAQEALGGSWLTNSISPNDIEFEREVAEFEAEIKTKAELASDLALRESIRELVRVRATQEAEAQKLEAARLLEIEERKEFLSSPLANSW